MTYREELLRLKIYGKQVAEKKIYRIPKVSPKRQLQIVENKVLLAQDKIFYKEIWDASPHNCQQCGCYLGKEAMTTFFHHLLPKKVYPQYRHTPENIMLLCAEHHYQVGMNIDKVPKVKSRTIEMEKLIANKY